MEKRYIVTKSGRRILWKQGEDFGMVEGKVKKEEFEVFYAKNLQTLKEKIKFSVLIDTFETENPEIASSPRAVILEKLQDFLRNKYQK